MNNNEILELSAKNQKRAFEVVDTLQIVEAWKTVDATANLVGSLRMGLLMKHKDIDFHIYSNNFSILDSFRAIALIANRSGVQRVSYNNLIDTEEKCLEWHLWYQDLDETEWQIDMIHILNDSPYCGYFEHVADRISAVMTPEFKLSILSIKNAIPTDEKIMGIEIYQAVIQDGIKNFDDFLLWRKQHQQTGIIHWIP